MEKLAPVVVFVYNRPDHTRKMLESLNIQPKAGLTDLYIFSDQAKNDNARVGVDQVRDLIADFANNKSFFQNVYITYADNNKGLANSIISGVSEIINKYGSAIVVEDDLILSRDFLDYMNAALLFYKSDNNIWAISGYTFEMDALNNYEHDVYVSGRGCSWGWGTWADRWNTVDWDVTDYKSIKFNPVKRSQFSKWGRDLPTMLDACVYGKIHSWAVRWCFAAFEQNKYTIYPCKSRVVSIGIDGSGTNFKSSNNNYITHLYEGTKACKFENVSENKGIQREFKKRYMTNKQWFNSTVAWFLIKLGFRK